MPMCIRTRKGEGALVHGGGFLFDHTATCGMGKKTERKSNRGVASALQRLILTSREMPMFKGFIKYRTHHELREENETEIANKPWFSVCCAGALGEIATHRLTYSRTTQFMCAGMRDE
jgi:hypothetical protein